MKNHLDFTIDKDFLPGKSLMEYMQNDGLVLATLEIGDVKTVFTISGKCVFYNKMKNPYSTHLLKNTSELDDEDRECLQKVAFSYSRAVEQFLINGDKDGLESFEKGHKEMFLEKNKVHYHVYFKGEVVFMGDLNLELQKGYKPNNFSILPSLSEAFMTVAGITVFGLYESYKLGQITNEEMSTVYDIMKYKANDFLLEDSFDFDEILDELNLLSTKAHGFSEETSIFYRKVGQFSQTASCITIVYKIDEDESEDVYDSYFDELESDINKNISCIVDV